MLVEKCTRGGEVAHAGATVRRGANERRRTV